MPEQQDSFGLTLGKAAGASFATSAPVVGLGLLMEKHNDKRQLRQQGKLNELANRQTDYNMQKQLDMWKQTGPVGQVEQYKEAGLNPALMYGMGGGGGQTANVATGTTSEAPKGGQEVMQATGMGLQMAMLQAQIENIKADTAKKETEAKYTAGPQTDLTKSQTSLNNANTGNVEVDTKLKGIQLELDRLDLGFQRGTYDTRMEILTETGRKLLGEANKAMVDGNIESDMKMTIEQTLKTELVGKILQNQLTSAQTDKVRSDITVNTAQISKWAQEVAQGWQALDNQQKIMKVDALMKEVDQIYKGTLGHMRTHDPASIAKQIDIIMNLRQEDFKK